MRRIISDEVVRFSIPIAEDYLLPADQVTGEDRVSGILI